MAGTSLAISTSIEKFNETSAKIFKIQGLLSLPANNWISLNKEDTTFLLRLVLVRGDRFLLRVASISYEASMFSEKCDPATRRLTGPEFLPDRAGFCSIGSPNPRRCAVADACPGTGAYRKYSDTGQPSGWRERDIKKQFSSGYFPENSSIMQGLPDPGEFRMPSFDHEITPTQSFCEIRQPGVSLDLSCLDGDWGPL